MAILLPFGLEFFGVQKLTDEKSPKPATEQNTPLEEPPPEEVLPHIENQNS
ncbi:MAG: hypothetical protein AAGC74_09215 [Verrucomicrobiota bacterium]